MSTNMIHTEIEIDAPPERVWQVLMDFPAFPEWNPFILKIEGRAEVGGKLCAIARPEGTKGMTITPTVLAVVPKQEFRWGGNLPIPGLMSAEHRFLLQKLDGNRTRLIHEEAFKGILIPLFMRLMGKGTLAAFHAMNRALKARVEGVTEKNDKK